MRIMALALVLAVMGAFLAPGTAAGQSERPIIVNYLAGPYKIGVLTEKSSLSVGRVIFTITVHDAASGEPAGDATVVIRTRHQSEGTEGWSSAFNSPADPETFSAQILLETPGVWDAFIEISGPLGIGAVSVGSLGVPHARTYTSGSYVFFGIFAALMAGGGYLTWSAHRNQKRRAALEAAATGPAPVTDDSPSGPRPGADAGPQ